MEITSKKNSFIKSIRDLSRKKNRIENKLFIAEGINIVNEIIDNDYNYKNIVYSDDLLNLSGGKELYFKFSKREDIVKVNSEVFNYISQTENPQGVLAISNIDYKKVAEIKDCNGIYILLDRLQDPGNLGTIIRTADAFNIKGIISGSGTVDAYNPKVVRASMGSIYRVGIYYIDNLVNDIEYLKKIGYKILSTEVEHSKSIKDVELKNSIIVIGNESTGVSDKILEVSDDKISINMPGRSESLNAAIAASIIMYESDRQI